MFQAVHKHLNASMIVALTALVFAMTGGAYAFSSSGGARAGAAAAKKHSKSSKGLRGPAGPRGATGPTGPAGAAGTQGAQGPAGEKGADGTNGASGESVSIKTLGKGQGGCPAGGAEFANAGGKGAACNGATGPEGVCATSNCVLPKGASLEGEFLIHEDHAEGFDVLETVGSFDVPLAVTPTTHLVPAGEPASGSGDVEAGSSKVTMVSASAGHFGAGSVLAGAGIPAGTIVIKNISPEEFEMSAAAETTAKGVTLTTSVPSGCSGNAEAPGAESGNLCVFMEEESNVFWTPALVYNPHVTATKFGFNLTLFAQEAGQVAVPGSWAVTG